MAGTEQRHLRTCVTHVLEGALSAYACACIKSTSARRKVGLAPKRRMKNEWNKWKNHFYEMKGDERCRIWFHGSPYAKELRVPMALLMLRSSGFHGSPYAKELRVPMALLMLRSSGFHGSPYAKELRVPWLSLC